MTTAAGARVALTLRASAAPAIGVLAAAHAAHSHVAVAAAPALECDAVLAVDGANVTGTAASARAIAALFPAAGLYGASPAASSLVDHWIDFASDNLLAPADFKRLAASFDLLDNHLTMRSFFVGYSATIADFVVWGALRGNAVFSKQLKSIAAAAAAASNASSSNASDKPHLLRWFHFVGSLEPAQAAVRAFEAARAAAAKSSKAPAAAAADSPSGKNDAASSSMAADLGLPDAIEGKVVTRFPPEPSGYLHIGHAKAALLNDFFARQYKGKLILRFDDTNPSKEKLEFEHSITEDLALLGIHPDTVSHTSDHFDHLYNEAIRLIKLGLAYVDDTDQETMRAQRFDGIESRCRNLSVEENLARFEQMRLGTPTGLTCCLRAKIDMFDKNKAMRDPVIYRCNLTPHHATGETWKIYPTYDFACPVIDSLEGVTHALRTIEYRDRNAQYAWFIRALNIRWVHVWDFSRLNFIYTLLSKRKLTWFVEQKLVTGWDDPRFPTVRGIRRRGLTIEALRSYIIAQGASQRDLMLEWDKIWAINKKVIDPIAPRHVAIAKTGAVRVRLVGGEGVPAEIYTRDMPKHKKNPDVGTKVTSFSNELYIEQEDAKDLVSGEEVTFMDWGNVIVKAVHHDATTSTVESIDVDLHLSGDFKKTKKKLTWLSAAPTTAPEQRLVPLVLLDYDYLITKKKLEEEDDVKDFLTPVTEFRVHAYGDANCRLLAHGDIIQLERKGYYICDGAFDDAKPDEPVRLIFIPDGKMSSLASKVAETANASVSAKGSMPKSSTKASAAAASAKPAATGSTASVVKMYKVDTAYGDMESIDVSKASKMYKVDPVYGVQTPIVTGAVSNGAKAVANPDKKEKKSKTKDAVVGDAAPAAVSAAPANDASLISKLDIVVGKVLEVRKHPDADSLYIEKIDIGEPEPREVVSGLVKYMAEADILGTTLLVLKNLKPVSMRGIKSYAMVLCASNADHSVVEFLIPPTGSVPGDRVVFAGYENGQPESQLNPKKKVWETVQPGFTTRDDLVAVWNGVPFQTSRGVVKSVSLVGASIK